MCMYVCIVGMYTLINTYVCTHDCSMYTHADRHDHSHICLCLAAGGGNDEADGWLYWPLSEAGAPANAGKAANAGNSENAGNVGAEAALSVVFLLCDAAYATLQSALCTHTRLVPLDEAGMRDLCCNGIIVCMDVCMYGSMYVWMDRCL